MIKNKKGHTKVVLISILIVALLLLSYFIIKTKQENDLLKTVLIINLKSVKIGEISQEADTYYQLSNRAYELNDFKGVEYNCRLARENYHKASQEYLKLKSELKGNNPITIKYKEGLSLLSEISLNLYEACEHFESASRYYDIYYNTNVSAFDNSYDMGGKEIDAMNEKIKLHDENIRKYNNLLTEILTELEMMAE